VTNQLQFLPAAHRIVVIDAGTVVASGTYEECLANDVFARLLSEHGAQSGESQAAVDAADEAGLTGPAAAEEGAAAGRGLSRADTAAVGRRAEVDALRSAPGLLGRGAVAELQRSETFAPRESGGGRGAPAVPGATPGGKGGEREEDARYGKPIARLETMKAQLALEGGKVGGVRGRG
jgi:hypothetical protein